MGTRTGIHGKSVGFGLLPEIVKCFDTASARDITRNHRRGSRQILADIWSDHARHHVRATTCAITDDHGHALVLKRDFIVRYRIARSQREYATSDRGQVKAPSDGVHPDLPI